MSQATVVCRSTNLGFIFLLMFAISSTFIFFFELFLISEHNRNDSYWIHEQHQIESKRILENQSNDFGNATKFPPSADATWQNVIGTRFKFYVYSAYLDDRKSDVVIRIIGITATRQSDHVWCLINYNHLTVNVPARIKIIRENWNLKYSAAFILCPLQKIAVSGFPISVSIVADFKLPLSNNLYIRSWAQMKTQNHEVKQIAACIKPLHFHYDDSMKLIEFLEINRLLGIKHFTFYNHTIGPKVDCILRDYQNAGIVSVLSWQLDIPSQVEIRTEGMFAALNDCLYRNMYKFNFVTVIDLDEIIVPRIRNNLPDLIEFLNSNRIDDCVGAFSFQNAFFYLQWKDDVLMKLKSSKYERNLISLKKTRRMTKLHPHKQRSKYICEAANVVEIGNHFIWQFIGDCGTLYVKPNHAMLHHYRICEFGGDDCISSNSTIDRTVHRYRKNLVYNVANRWSQMKTVCSLPKLA